MLELLRLFMICGTVLFGTFLVLLSMPASRLREVVQPMIGWAISGLSAMYIISPIDLIPDIIPVVGWGDDVIALGVVIASAYLAVNTPKKIR
jgi:uncharacterized membrane protein YkvA (DUF1232 family)